MHKYALRVSLERCDAMRDSSIAYSTRVRREDPDGQAESVLSRISRQSDQVGRTHARRNPLPRLLFPEGSITFTRNSPVVRVNTVA